MKIGTLEITLHYVCTEAQCRNALRTAENRMSKSGHYTEDITKLQVNLEKFIEQHWSDNPIHWSHIDVFKEGNYGVQADILVSFQKCEQNFGDLDLMHLLRALRNKYKLLTRVTVNTYPDQIDEDTGDLNEYRISSNSVWARDHDRVKQSRLPDCMLDAILAASDCYGVSDEFSQVQNICAHLLDSMWKEPVLAQHYTQVFGVGDVDGSAE